MNKKITVKNTFDKIVYCVLSDEQSFEEQMKEVLSLSPGQGYTVEITDDAVLVKDYFVNEAVGRFEILSITDTNEEVFYYWKKAE